MAKKQNTKSKSKASARFKKEDITTLMLRDHKPLKRLIKTLKEPDKEWSKLKAAFEEFAPMLEAHAHPEQESLYTYMKREEDEEVRIEGFEGFTEHALADQLAAEIKSISNEEDWKAHVKVLAELVEHHIEEEEEEMIPDLRKELEEETRIEIGRDYLERRAKLGAPMEKAA